MEWYKKLEQNPRVGKLHILLSSYAALRHPITTKELLYINFILFLSAFPLALSEMSEEHLLPITRNDIFSIPCPHGVKYSHIYKKYRC